MKLGTQMDPALNPYAPRFRSEARELRNAALAALHRGRLQMEDAIYTSNEYRKNGDPRDLDWARHCTEMATRYFGHAALCRSMMKDRLYAARTGRLERPVRAA